MTSVLLICGKESLETKDKRVITDSNRIVIPTGLREIYPWIVANKVSTHYEDGYYIFGDSQVPYYLVETLLEPKKAHTPLVVKGKESRLSARAAWFLYDPEERKTRIRMYLKGLDVKLPELNKKALSAQAVTKAPSNTSLPLTHLDMIKEVFDELDMEALNFHLYPEYIRKIVLMNILLGVKYEDPDLAVSDAIADALHVHFNLKEEDTRRLQEFVESADAEQLYEDKLEENIKHYLLFGKFKGKEEDERINYFEPEAVKQGEPEELTKPEPHVIYSIGDFVERNVPYPTRILFEACLDNLPNENAVATLIKLLEEEKPDRVQHGMERDICIDKLEQYIEAHGLIIEGEADVFIPAFAKLVPEHRTLVEDRFPQYFTQLATAKELSYEQIADEPEPEVIEEEFIAMEPEPVEEIPEGPFELHYENGQAKKFIPKTPQEVRVYNIIKKITGVQDICELLMPVDSEDAKAKGELDYAQELVAFAQPVMSEGNYSNIIKTFSETNELLFANNASTNDELEVYNRIAFLQANPTVTDDFNHHVANSSSNLKIPAAVVTLYLNNEGVEGTSRDVIESLIGHEISMEKRSLETFKYLLNK